MMRIIGGVAAGFALVASVIGLIGWLFGWPSLTDWDGDGIAMLANTAIAGILGSVAVLILTFTRRSSHRAGQWVVVTLGAITGLIGGLTLCEHLFAINLGIDTLVVNPTWGERAAAAPGRMGPPASSTFLLLGAAIVLEGIAKSRLSRRIASSLTLIAMLPPIITWSAYFYGANPLYSLPQLTGIARQTAAILFCIALTLVLAQREYGLGAILRRKDAAGTMMRRLLPISVVLLLLTGWLEHRGELAQLYDHAFGSAVLTIFRIIIFTALLWWTARALIVQISRRRILESELSESQERFGVMVDSIPQLAWMARPDGWIFWYNRQWHEYTGTTPKQMEGWGWKDVHSPDHLSRVMKSWKYSLSSGEPWEDTFPLRAADGSYRWFLSRARPVRDESGKVTLWFGTNTDISEQREAENALRQTNRMKDEFLATLSHELRTPMSAILGWSQMLRRSSQPADLGHGLEVIERNARLQSQIIEDLLDMSRIISGKVRLDVQSMQIDSIINAAVEAIRPAANAKQLQVQVFCGSQLNDVRGDPNRIQQVLYNLLTNSVKFTPAGGTVQVSCSRVGSHVEISVSDTGIGIKSEFLPFLFDRFRQQDASTTRRFGGLGLGLAIVKSLVELHGGSVHVASDGEDKGSTFTIHLPVAISVLPAAHNENESHYRKDLAATSSNFEEASQSDYRLDGISALIVDDEPDARLMMKRLLEEHGACAMVAGSASEFLEMLRDNLPDILVCDIGMPGMDGYDLIRAVRRLPPEQGGRLPAIALTAFARSEDRTRSMQAGFQLHLSKPVEFFELVASIANLAGKANSV